MRALRVLVAAVVAALSIVVVGAGPSFACSCVMAGTATHVKWADVVVTGTLLDRVPPEKKRLMSSTDPATYVVAVDGVFKGEAAPVIEIRSHNDGASCGLELVAEDKRYVFFAGYESKGEDRGEQRLWANLCGGSGPATQRLVAAVQASTGLAEPEPDANAAAHDSELVVTMDPEPAPEEDEDPLAAWAVPIGLAAGGSLVLLAGALWLRYRLS